MQEFFADFHCHSITKSCYSQRAVNGDKYTPFEGVPHQIKSNILNHFRGLIERVSEIKLESQSNFDALYAGGHRIAIVSLSPPEKAFFIMNQQAHDSITDELRTFAEFKKVPYEGTIKNEVINALTGFSIEDISFCKSTGLNYYTDLLKREFEYLKSFNNKKSDKGYTVRLVKNFNEIETILIEDPKTLCLICSVEGGHSLGNSYGYGDLLRNQGKSHKEDPNVYGQTITSTRDYVLNIEDMKKWEYPPLFISLFHHFWNELGGHGRSLNKMMSVLINQEEGINLGITKTGKLVIKELLSKMNGRRILIDIKHMSPRSRRDYYIMLKEEAELREENIKIVCSHTGVVSRRNSLNEMIDLSDHGDWDELNETGFEKWNYLHECSINLCAEDMMHIFKSGGLIGIQLDEKRIAGKKVIKAIKEIKNHTENDVRIEYAKVLLANIFRVVEVINRREAWDIVCIGSDFDGIINHLDSFPTSREVPKLKATAISVLKSKSGISRGGFNYSLTADQINSLMFNYSFEEILDKVFYTNVRDFLKENF